MFTYSFTPALSFCKSEWRVERTLRHRVNLKLHISQTVAAKWRSHFFFYGHFYAGVLSSGPDAKRHVNLWPCGCQWSGVCLHPPTPVSPGSEIKNCCFFEPKWDWLKETWGKEKQSYLHLPICRLAMGLERFTVKMQTKPELFLFYSDSARDLFLDPLLTSSCLCEISLRVLKIKCLTL